MMLQQSRDDYGMSDLRETTFFAILCNKLLQKYGKNINKSANYFTDGP